MLGSEEIGVPSLARDMTLVAESSDLPLDLPTRLSHEGTMVSSSTYAEDLETPVLFASQIYPVAPEHFQRYEKRRKM